MLIGCWMQRQSTLPANCDPPRANPPEKLKWRKPQEGNFLKLKPVKLEKTRFTGLNLDKDTFIDGRSILDDYFCIFLYLVIDICIYIWNLHLCLIWSPKSINIFLYLDIRSPIQHLKGSSLHFLRLNETHLLALTHYLSCRNKIINCSDG